jgi:hypothetical protein
LPAEHRWPAACILPSIEHARPHSTSSSPPQARLPQCASTCLHWSRQGEGPTTALSAWNRTRCLCFNMSTMSSTPSASTNSCLQVYLSSSQPLSILGL